MAPKTEEAPAADNAAYSQHEIKFLAAICKVTRPANIDWDAVAAEAGLNGARSSRETFRRICKRHGWSEAGDNAESCSTTPKAAGTKRTPGSRSTKKSAVPRMEDDSDGGAVPETPTTKKRKTIAARKQQAEVTDKQKLRIEDRVLPSIDDDVFGVHEV
ncbi:hypothetical protein BX600DRAFT_431308 [Xylariales sp. PMI_506]|nr:hypothetical protein BX600DRAFT_431308 [Xylariales sp. PMI_506]